MRSTGIVAQQYLRNGMSVSLNDNYEFFERLDGFESIDGVLVSTPNYVLEPSYTLHIFGYRFTVRIQLWDGLNTRVLVDDYELTQMGPKTEIGEYYKYIEFPNKHFMLFGDTRWHIRIEDYLYGATSTEARMGDYNEALGMVCVGAFKKDFFNQDYFEAWRRNYMGVVSDHNLQQKFLLVYNMNVEKDIPYHILAHTLNFFTNSTLHPVILQMFDNKVFNLIPVADDIMDVKYSYDGKKLYVFYPNRTDVYVVDKEYVKVDTIPHGLFLRGRVENFAGLTIFITNNKDLLMISPEEMRLLRFSHWIERVIYQNSIYTAVSDAFYISLGSTLSLTLRMNSEGKWNSETVYFKYISGDKICMYTGTKKFAFLTNRNTYFAGTRTIDNVYVVCENLVNPKIYLEYTTERDSTYKKTKSVLLNRDGCARVPCVALNMKIGLETEGLSNAQRKARITYFEYHTKKVGRRNIHGGYATRGADPNAIAE